MTAELRLTRRHRQQFIDWLTARLPADTGADTARLLWDTIMLEPDALRIRLVSGPTRLSIELLVRLPLIAFEGPAWATLEARGVCATWDWRTLMIPVPVRTP